MSILATSMTAIVFAVAYLNVGESSRGPTNRAFLAENISYSSEAASIISQDYASSDFVAHGSTSPSGGSGTSNAVIRVHLIVLLSDPIAFSHTNLLRLDEYM